MPISDEKFASKLLQAWAGTMSFPELIEFTSVLENQKLGPLAAVLYQTFLSKTDSPYAHAVNFNLGVTLSNENDFAGAEAAYRRAIEIYPAFAQPRLNLGTVYERTKQLDKAIEQWQWVALNIPPGLPENKPLLLMALNNLGRVLDTGKQLEEALGYLTRSLAIEPNQRDVIHHWVHLRQKQCVWPIYTPIAGLDEDQMKGATSALAMIAVTDEPAMQLKAAQRYASDKLMKNAPQLANMKAYGHKRLRIAYLSSDFCLHPVSLLMVELFELHNRAEFEVYGFCWSPEDGSAMRARVIAGMDHFIRIHQMSDSDAAQLIRSHEIDILVDLQGQTSGARANILAHRPAPIQITYLGLPATTGLPCVDYVIADHFLIPDDIALFYSEKPLYMPDIYQVSDRKRSVGPVPSRKSCGLPAQGFVFCSLNNNYKYTPEVFDVWMNILRRVPGSLLWLLADNPWAQGNLIREAQNRGIQSGRLFFAPRVSPENYLARYKVADLFLDTFPFNAGTTANDALWMGLPVLTLTGRTFASRMAGALLTAAGLPELITYTLEDYEEKAVALGNNPAECQRLKEHLGQAHVSGPLFDTPRFAHNLESRLKALVAEL